MKKKSDDVKKAFEHITGAEVPHALKALAKRPMRAPTHVDPVAELRRLVGLHKGIVRNKVELENRSSDRKIRETGEIIPCRLPPDVRLNYAATVASLDAHANSLKLEMGRALRGIPIYDALLSKMWGGMNPIASSYIASMVRIDRAVKVSNLIRYCGWACDTNGRLERRATGPKYDPSGKLTGEAGTFNDDIRRVLWVAMGTARKNGGKKTAGAPYGQTTKYLDVWFNAKHRGVSAGMKPGAAESKGMAKALAVLIEDVYVVWRTLEGLPVWPSYYSAKLGYAHGGQKIDIASMGPRILTLDEALATVGDVGARPLESTRAWTIDLDVDNEEELSEAAE